MPADNIFYNDLLIKFLQHLKSNGKSLHTVSAYRTDLAFFCEYLAIKNLTPEQLTPAVQEDWLFFLKNKGRTSHTGLRRAQMSVRTFLHFLLSEKHIEQAPLLNCKPLQHATSDTLAVSPKKFSLLWKKLKAAALQGEAKAIRDLAVVLVLGECGLKVSEAANLTWQDLGPETKVKSAWNGSLRIPGKNPRIVTYGPNVVTALRILKKTRAQLQLTIHPNAKLFFGYRNISRKTITPSLHRHGIKFVIYEVSTNILNSAYNSESLRNHAILTWIAQGKSLEQVAELAGYTSLNSLQRFLKLFQKH